MTNGLIALLGTPFPLSK